MRKKILGAAIAVSVVVGGVAISTANAEGEKGGIPAQINELKAAVSDLTIQVKDLLPLNEDVESVKDKVSSVNGTISEQEKSLDSMRQQIEDLKKEIEELKASPVTVDPDGQQVQQRLSFDGANFNLNVSLLDTEGDVYKSYLSVPNKVVYLWEKNNPEDKLVGVTDYKGNILFKVVNGKEYIVEYKGDDRYKPKVGSVVAIHYNSPFQLHTYTY